MINQLLFKRRGSQGPVVPTGPKDPLLNYVSLLLNSDGVNGGANNVFLDSSPNNYSVTKSGTVNQGSFSPFIPGGWSVEMASASSQQLQYPASAEFQISGNWTIECWVWLNNYSTGSSMLVGNYQANSPTDWMLMVNNVGRVDMYHSGLTGSISVGSVPTNAWVHIAAVKSGTTITVYVNGVSVGTTTSSATLGDATRVIRVGGRSVANTYLNGYISNLRVVRSAVYTANFTPPKGALEVIPGVTSLLTCRSNRFQDLSPNNHAVTLINGGGNIKPMSPQEFSSYYEQSVHGSSMYFAGGVSDYLSANTGPLNLGSANMTFDCWVYPTSFAAARGLISQWPTATNGCLQVLITTSGTIQQIYRITGTTVTSTSSRALTLFAWNHVAVVRNGNVFTIYVNGVADTNIITNSGSLDNSTAPVSVGYGGDGLNPMLGYLADVRIVAGTAIYTSSFTPPTTPVTPGSPVEKLLVKGANANIIDRVAKNLINTVGVARIANTAKYGNGSVVHQGGVNNYLQVLDNEGFNFGSSPFTVEAWVNISAVGSGGGGILGRWGSGPSAVTDWLLYIDASLKPSFVVGGSVVASPNAIAINTWNHIAVTRTGSIYYLWVNGVKVASANIGGTITVGARPIRTSRWDSSTGFLTGYIDDLRVTRGVARYTAAFTPPTEALPIY